MPIKELRLFGALLGDPLIKTIVDALNEIRAPRKGIPEFVGTAPIVVSTDTTMSREYSVYLVNSDAAAIILTLPPCEGGRHFRVYRIGTNTVTVQVPAGSADVINASTTSKAIGTIYHALDLVGIPSVTAGVPALKWDALALTAA